MSKVGFGVANSYATVKLYSGLMSQVSKIVKQKKLDDVREALSDNEKMKAFATDVYSKLSFDVKSKITIESFIQMAIEKKEMFMKVGKNIKKLKGKK